MNLFLRLPFFLSLLTVAGSLCFTNPSLGSENSRTPTLNDHQRSVLLSILGKNILQFISIGIATSYGHSLPGSRHLEDEIAEHQAIAILKAFEKAFESSNTTNQEVILKADQIGYTYISSQSALKTKASYEKYLKFPSEDNDNEAEKEEYLLFRKKLVDDLKSMLTSTLKDLTNSDNEKVQFEFVVEKIKKAFETIQEACENKNSTLVDIALVNITLSSFTFPFLMENDQPS